MTYEQFLKTVPDDVHAEWIDGEVVPMTPISRDHNELSVFLLALLQHYVEAQNLGSLLAMEIASAAADDSAEELETDLDSLSQGANEGSMDFAANGFQSVGNRIKLDHPELY